MFLYGVRGLCLFQVLALCCFFLNGGLVILDYDLLYSLFSIFYDLETSLQRIQASKSGKYITKGKQHKDMVKPPAEVNRTQ